MPHVILLPVASPAMLPATLGFGFCRNKGAFAKLPFVLGTGES